MRRHQRAVKYVIKHVIKHDNDAYVYRKLREAGYTKTYDSMCRQIRKMKVNTVKK